MSLPKVKLTGGPHGAQIKLTVDDREVPGVHRLEIVAEPSDAIRVTQYQFATVEIDAEALYQEKGYFIRVYKPVIDVEKMEITGRELMAEGKGPTLRTALLAAAASLPDGGSIN